MVTALVVAYFLILSSVAGQPRTYVLETGAYEKITIDNGEVWLGLYPAADHAELRPCTLQVSRVANPVDGTYPPQVTKVQCAGEQPLFILKGSPKVKAGNVASVYKQGDDYPTKIAVTLAGKKYVLETSDKNNVESLTLNGKLLGQCGSRDSVYPVWAGDLDGDGRLDVYLRIEHHNFGIEEILFLSSDQKTAKFTGRKLD